MQARHRWLLSGTPVQNGPEELFAYFCFLRYAPFDSLAAFQALMKEEAVLGEGTPAVTRLRNILRPVMLRRTKASAIDGVPILALPPRYCPCLPCQQRSDRACTLDTFITALCMWPSCLLTSAFMLRAWRVDVC